MVVRKVLDENPDRVDTVWEDGLEALCRVQRNGRTYWAVIVGPTESPEGHKEYSLLTEPQPHIWLARKLEEQKKRMVVARRRLRKLTRTLVKVNAEVHA
jgi:hypothetical protein